jgi:hypothetical protein
MKKSDLKNGMLIQTGDRHWNLLIDDYMYDLLDMIAIDMDEYDDDLNYEYVYETDLEVILIAEVEDISDILACVKNKKSVETIHDFHIIYGKVDGASVPGCKLFFSDYSDEELIEELYKRRQ